MTPSDAFALLDLRVGRIERCQLNAGAKKPAFKLWIDFGPLGLKQSSTQLTTLYSPETLVGRLVVAAVNLGSKTVNGFASEVLVLGAPDGEGNVVLLSPESDVPLGGKVF